jgi:hypothetical protein
LSDTAISILGAGTMLHAERADLPAGGNAGNRVGHMQADPLLPHDNRADVGLRGVLQQMVHRIAAEDLDPLPLHDFSDRVSDFHLSGLPPRGLQTKLADRLEARLHAGNRRVLATGPPLVFRRGDAERVGQCAA